MMLKLLLGSSVIASMFAQIDSDPTQWKSLIVQSPFMAALVVIVLSFLRHIQKSDAEQLKVGQGIADSCHSQQQQHMEKIERLTETTHAVIERNSVAHHENTLATREVKSLLERVERKLS